MTSWQKECVDLNTGRKQWPVQQFPLLITAKQLFGLTIILEFLYSGSVIVAVECVSLYETLEHI